ncbi:MAG: DNA-binding transcriptional MocR family regulator [Akkermansiaceae bacterium]
MILNEGLFMPQTLPLYQVLADRLSDLIQGGTFRPGDKLPSIRQASRDNQVSVTTILQSYHLLEDRGMVEAHSRSGYFVSPPSKPLIPRSPVAVYRAKPVRIETSCIFETVMDLVENRDVIPFAAAAPDDPIISLSRLPSLAAAVFRKYGADASHYTPPTGRRELRMALSRRLLGCGIKAMPDEIVTTHGATEALILALRATTQKGDLVAVESPTYFGILNLIRDQGLRAIEIPVCQATGLSIEALETALAKHPIKACVVQPNFQNPVGCVMPSKNKKRLAKLSNAHEFTIIEDDVYGDLGHSGERPSSIGLHGGDVIHCGSTSKTVAPGLRVGWIVPGTHLKKIKHLKTMQCPWNATLSELMLSEFFERGSYDRHLRRIRKIYASQCAKMHDEIIRHFPQSCKVTEPPGGFVLWLEMPEGFDAEAYTVEAILHGISVVPGTIFSPTLQFENCLRLSCGAALTPVRLEALATLGRLAALQLKS